MRVLEKLRDVKPEVLGNDNTLMIDPALGPYMIKNGDFHARRTGTPVNVYPITRESATKVSVSEYRAILTEQDYRNVVTTTPPISNN